MISILEFLERLSETNVISISELLERLSEIIDISVEQILEICKILDINVDDENDLIYQEDLNKICEYIENVIGEQENSNDNTNKTSLLGLKNYDEYENYDAKSMEDLEAYFGDEFDIDNILLQPTNVYNVYLQVQVAVEYAKNVRKYANNVIEAIDGAPCVSNCNEIVSSINTVTDFLIPFSSKFYNLLQELCELDPTFNSQFIALSNFGEELDPKYLDPELVDDVLEDRGEIVNFTDWLQGIPEYSDVEVNYWTIDEIKADPELGKLYTEYQDAVNAYYSQSGKLEKFTISTGVELPCDTYYELKELDPSLFATFLEWDEVYTYLDENGFLDNFNAAVDTHNFDSRQIFAVSLDGEGAENPYLKCFTYDDLKQIDAGVYKEFSMQSTSVQLFLYENGFYDDYKGKIFDLSDMFKYNTWKGVDNYLTDQYGMWIQLRDDEFRKYYGDFCTVSEFSVFVNNLNHNHDEKEKELKQGLFEASIPTGSVAAIMLMEYAMTQKHSAFGDSSSFWDFGMGFVFGYIVPEYDNEGNVVGQRYIAEDEFVAGSYNPEDITVIDGSYYASDPKFFDIFVNVSNNGIDWIDTWYDTDEYAVAHQGYRFFYALKNKRQRELNDYLEFHTSANKMCFSWEPGSLKAIGKQFTEYWSFAISEDFDEKSQLSDADKAEIDKLKTGIRSGDTNFTSEENLLIMKAMLSGDKDFYVQDGNLMLTKGFDGPFGSDLMIKCDESLEKIVYYYDKTGPNGETIFSGSDCALMIYNLNTKGDIGDDWVDFYLDNHSDRFDETYFIYQQMEDAQWAKDHRFAASMYSWVVTPFEGINAAWHSLTSLITGEEIDRLDVYSRGNVYRQSVAESFNVVDEVTGEVNTAGSFVYNSAMSMLDTLPLMAATYLTGGTSLAGTIAGKAVNVALSAALMGSRSYVATLNDALDRGLSDGQAVLLAGASAVVETLMESYSASNLVGLGDTAKIWLDEALDSVKSTFMKKIVTLAGSAVIQGVCEGEEEFATEVLNSFLDRVVGGENSQFCLAVKGYMAQGYSEEQAFAKAVQDNSEQCVMAFVGGFLSGVGFGGGSVLLDVNTVADDVIKAFKDSSFNVDEKSLRINLKNGDYASAMSVVLDAQGLDASQKVLMLGIIDNFVGSVESGTDYYVSQGINEFVNLDIKEQLKSFDKLDDKSKVALLETLSSNGVSLFLSLDASTQKSIFDSLSLDTKLQILNNCDSKIQANLLGDSITFNDFIINNKADIDKIRTGQIAESIRDRLGDVRLLLSKCGFNENTVNKIINKLSSKPALIQQVYDEIQEKLGPSDRALLKSYFDGLSSDFRSYGQLQNVYNIALCAAGGINSDNYKTILACLLYPDARKNLSANDLLNMDLSIVLTSNNMEATLNDFSGESHFSQLKQYVDNIKQQVDDFRSKCTNNELAKARRENCLALLTEYFERNDINISEEDFSVFVDNNGDISSTNRGKLAKLLSKITGDDVATLSYELNAYFKSDSFVEGMQVDMDVVNKSVDAKCYQYQQVLFLQLKNGLNGSTSINNSTNENDSSIVVEQNNDNNSIDINNAVADILSTVDPMDTLTQYEGDVNYDAIFEKVSDALAVVDKVFDANAKTEVDAARRVETITQLMEYFNENNIPVTEDMLSEIIGDAGIDVNNVQDTRDTVNNLGKVIADVTGQHIQDAVNGLYNFIQGDTFSSSIQVVEDTALGDLQVKTDLVLENLVLGVTNGTITDINAYLNGVLESSGLDITIDGNQEIVKNEGGTTVIGDGTIHVDGNENIDVVSDEEVTVDGVVETGNNENIGGFSNNGITGDGIDTDNAETSGKDHFDNVSGIVPIGLKSDTDDMGDNKSDRKIDDKDNKDAGNASEMIGQEQEKNDNKNGNNNDNTINEDKKRFMDGIEAMDNKSGDAGVGLRAIYDYLVNDNFKGITTAGNFRQFIRSMDRATLIKFYNEMAIDYNNSHGNDLLLMVHGNIVNSQTGNLFNYFVKLHNFIVNILNDNRAMSLKMFQNNSGSLKILVNKFGNIIENLMNFNNMDTKIDSTDDSYNSLKTLLLECKNAINEFANTFGNLGKSTKGKGLKIPTYLSSIFSNISDTLNSALEYVNQLYNGDVNLDTKVNSNTEVVTDTVIEENGQIVVGDKLKHVSDAELQSLISGIYKDGSSDLAIWIENGGFSDADLVRIMSSLGSKQLMNLQQMLDLRLQNEIYKKTGYLSFNENVDYCVKFIEDNLVPTLKSFFPMISDTKLNELLGIFKFYSDSRYSFQGLDGIGKTGFSNVYLNVDAPSVFGYVDTKLKLLDMIVHESVHYVATSVNSNGWASGFVGSDFEFMRGFNEAVTQYFTELIMGDTAYRFVYGKDGVDYVSTGYDYITSQVRSLVDGGIFNLHDFINAYCNNDSNYVLDTLSKYLSDARLKSFFECLINLSKCDNVLQREGLHAELDQYITEIAKSYEKSLLEISEVYDMPIDSKDGAISVVDEAVDTGKVTDGDSFNIDLRNKLENLGTVIGNLIEKITSNAKLWASNEFHRHVDFLNGKIDELRNLVESLKSKSDSVIDLDGDSYDTESSLSIEVKNLIQTISSYVQTLGSKIKSYGSKITGEFSNSFSELATSLNNLYEQVKGTFERLFPGKYKNLTELQVDVAEANQINKNFKGLISSFINALKFNPNVDLYGTLVDYGSTKKNLPDSKVYKRFFEKAKSYKIQSQKHYFNHFSTNGFSYHYGKDIKHRLYINADYTDTFKFFEYFIKKCEERNIPFYFKTGYFDFNGNGVVYEDITLTRSESGVIYATDQYIVEYTNICLEIAAEHPELKFMSPPAVTSAINGWLGYGMEPAVHDSFNSVRAKVFNDALFNGVNSFISANGNLTCSNGMTVNQLMIQLLHQEIVNSYRIADKQVQQQLWQHLSSNMDFYVDQLNSGSEFKLGNMYDIRVDMISGIKYQLCGDFLANSELVYRAIYDAFVDSCRKNYVDPNNFALNDPYGNSSAMSYDEFVGNEKTSSHKIGLQFFGGNVDTSNNGDIVFGLTNDVNNAIKAQDIDALSSIMAKLSVDNLRTLFKDLEIKTYIEDMIVNGKLEIMDSTLLNEIIKGLSKDKLAIAVNSDSLKPYICTMFIDGDLIITDNVILSDILNNMNSYQVEEIMKNSNIKTDILDKAINGEIKIKNEDVLFSILSAELTEVQRLSILRNSDVVIYSNKGINVTISNIVSYFSNDTAIKDFISNYKNGVNTFVGVNNIQMINAINSMYKLLNSKGIKIDSLSSLYEFTKKFDPTGIDTSDLKVNLSKPPVLSKLTDEKKKIIVSKLVALKGDDAKGKSFDVLKAMYPDDVKKLVIEQYKEIVRNDKIKWPSYRVIASQNYDSIHGEGAFDKLSVKEQNDLINKDEGTYKSNMDYIKTSARNRYEARKGRGTFDKLNSVDMAKEIDEAAKALTTKYTKLYDIALKYADEVAQKTIDTVENLKETGALLEGVSVEDVLLMVQDDVSPVQYLKPEVISYWRNSWFDGLSDDMKKSQLVEVYMFQSENSGVLTFGGGVGRPGEGAFVTSTVQYNWIIDPANGIFDENGLCIDKAKLTYVTGGVEFGVGNIIAIKQTIPIDSLKMPSGNLDGAFTGEWCPGGFTSGGAIEGISPNSKIDFSNIRIENGKLVSSTTAMVNGKSYSMVNEIILFETVTDFDTDGKPVKTIKLDPYTGIKKMVMSDWNFVSRLNLEFGFDPNDKSQRKSFDYLYGKDSSKVNDLIVREFKDYLMKTASLSVMADIDKIVSDKIKYYQELINSGIFGSSLKNVYDLLRMVTTGVKLENIINIDSISSGNIGLLLKNDDIRQYIIREVINGNIKIVDSSILDKIIISMNVSEMELFLDNFVNIQLVKNISDASFYNYADVVIEIIRKNNNSLYMKYYKDFVDFYKKAYLIDNTRIRIPFVPKINTKTEFIDIATILGYDRVAIDALVSQIGKDVANNSMYYSLENLDRLYVTDSSLAERFVEYDKDVWMHLSKSEKEGAYNTLISRNNHVNILYYQMYSNAMLALRLTKINELNGVYADCDGNPLTASDITIKRMEAKNQKYTPQKIIKSSNGVDYTNDFPRFDDIYSNNHVYEWTRDVLKLTDQEIMDFCVSNKFTPCDKIDALGFYLRNNSTLKVEGNTYQDATFGHANLAKFGSVGPASQVYEISDSSGNTVAKSLWPNEVLKNISDIDFNKKYNYSGGAYVLLTDNATMNKNFPEYTKLDGEELKITNMIMFGYDSLSGVVLSSLHGAYRINVKVPISLCSIPSINNVCMYTAEGVPGGRLASNELETVIPSIDVSSFLEWIGDPKSKYKFKGDFSGTYDVKDHTGKVIGIIEFNVSRIMEEK